MKVKGKILFILSGILMILAFYLNIDNFIMGTAPEIVSLCSSVLFIMTYCGLSFMKKTKKTAVILIIYNGFIAITSLAASVVGAYGSSAAYLLPFVLIALPPFYGLSLFCNIYALYLLISVLSTLLCIVDIYLWKKDPSG